jgi:hypothetical protein
VDEHFFETRLAPLKHSSFGQDVEKGLRSSRSTKICPVGVELHLSSVDSGNVAEACAPFRS